MCVEPAEYREDCAHRPDPEPGAGGAEERTGGRPGERRHTDTAGNLPA